MNKRPFTLIEILITIGIILILTGLLVGGVKMATAKASQAKTNAIMESFADALEKYRSAKGYYPPCSSEKDVEIVEHNGHFSLKLDDKYFVFEDSAGKPLMEFQATSTAKNLEDAWGNPLQYKCPGSHNESTYDLSSKGPKADDDDDNLTNWKRRN